MAAEMSHEATRKMREGVEDISKTGLKRRKISCSKLLYENLMGTSWEEETTSERMTRREEMRNMKMSPFSDHDIVIKTMKELFDAEDMILFILQFETDQHEMHQRLISMHRRMRSEILERLTKMACRKPGLLDLPAEVILKILSELPTFSDLQRVKQVCKQLQEVGDAAKLKMHTLKVTDLYRSNFTAETCVKHLDKHSIKSFTIQYCAIINPPPSLAQDVLTQLPNVKELTLVGGFSLNPLPRHVETVHLEEVSEKHYMSKRSLINCVMEWTGKFHRVGDPELEGLPCKRVLWKDDKIFLHDDAEDSAKGVLVVVPYEVQLRDASSDNSVFATRHFVCGPEPEKNFLSYFPTHDFFQRVVSSKWGHDGFSKRCELDIEHRFGEEHRKTALVVGFRRRFLQDRVKIVVDVEEFDEDPNDEADY